jgi:hypothetical protein
VVNITVMTVPNSLRFWFVIHFAVDYVFGIPLLLFPTQLLAFLGWPVIDVLAARLVGAALLGIGGISLIARNAGRETYRHMLTMKLIWSASAILGILLSMPGYPAVAWLMLGLFAGFGCVWSYYLHKLCVSRPV